MSALTCAEVRELAPELALGILGWCRTGRGRCCTSTGAPRCQAYVVELTEAADALPQLVPEVEPPAGFEARVLRRLGDDRRRSRRRWVASIAAVAAAVAIVSITIVRVVEAGDTTSTAALDHDGAGARRTGRGGDGRWHRLGPGGMGLREQPPRCRGVRRLRHPVRQLPGAGRAVEGRADVDRHHDRRIRPRFVDRPQRRAARAGARIALVDATGHEVCHGTVPTAE